MPLVNRLFIAFLFVTLLSTLSLAQSPEPTTTVAPVALSVPRLISFSGTIANARGTMGATFALYKDQTGGAPLWLETQNVVLDEKGRYTIVLGANHAQGIPVELFIAGEARWLGVQPEGQAELPRVLLVSVPYALKSADADTFGGRPLSAFVLAGDTTGAGSDGLNYINTKVLQTATSALYAGTPGTIAKFGLDGSSMVSSMLTENNGKIGVGTSAPGFTLDIQNTDTSAAGAQLLNVQTSSINGARIFFSSTAANGRAYGIGSNFISGQGEFGVYDYTADVPRMVIRPNGYMGVGVSNPEYLLDLATTDKTATGSRLLQLTTASVDGAKITFNSLSSNGRSYGFGSNFILGQGEFGIYDYNANATRLMVDAAGNVGIGTTSSAKLTVGGDVAVGGSGAGIIFADGSKQITAAVGGVTSFKGRSGVVVPATDDYSFAQISGAATLPQLPTTVVNSTGTYANPSWLTALDGTKITGMVANATNATNATTVTNGVYTTGSYSNPAWLTALAASKIAGAVSEATHAVSADAAATAATATNALNLNGIAPGSYARRDVGNSFTGDQSISGSATMSGNLALPNTTATVGKITLGGTLFLHNFGNANTFVGAGAGNISLTGSYNTGFGSRALGPTTTGSYNSAFGSDALFQNTTGSFNTAFGRQALMTNTTGIANAGFGYEALTSNTTGASNSAFGSAMFANTTGSQNAAFGYDTLSHNTIGNNNAAFGVSALAGNLTGASNAAFGHTALSSLASGSANIAIGQAAGTNLTAGSGNIYIGTPGGASSESFTIRIGIAGTQTAAYMAGISGATISSGVAVLVNSSGQLGTATSSVKFKHEVVGLGGESDVLMKLRPVAFYYKHEYDPTQIRQYGLVAEEVAAVAPHLVIFDEKGAPQTVRYQFVSAMLLNEVQKQRQLIEEQQATIGALESKLQDLEARLAKLEAAVAGR